MAGSRLIRASQRLAAKAETADEEMALWSCQCYLFPVPDLICTITASVVTCPIFNLVVAVFITCTNAASNQDGISDSGCCGLIIMQAGEGALGR